MTSNLPPLILAIDTSCDETSAAVTWGRNVLSSVIASQTQLHQAYGGVYPTLAKQEHQKKIKPVVQTALKRAQVKLKELTAIAVTQGPGLAPALEIGLAFGKKTAKQTKLPLIAVNHLEGHALSVLAKPRPNPTNESNLAPWQKNQLKQEIAWPVLAIIVSGGHTQFVLLKKIGHYQILGQTIDDALGEALDKVGRMINLGYPAGPVLEKIAKNGQVNRFKFPLPMTTQPNFNLSYSGLKTAANNLLTQLKKQQPLTQQDIYDFAASFQQAAFKHLTYKLDKLLTANQQLKSNKKIQQVWLGGGVAANIKLRAQIRQVLKPHNLKLKTPYKKQLCSDNAAMIGLVANFCYQEQKFANKKSLERQPSMSFGRS